MKESSYNQAKQIWRRERRLTDEKSYMNVILRVYDACCDAPQETDDSVLSTVDSKLMTILIGLANTRTGLEKICIRQIANDKRYRRGQLLDLVFCTLDDKYSFVGLCVFE